MSVDATVIVDAAPGEQPSIDQNVDFEFLSDAETSDQDIADVELDAYNVSPDMQVSADAYVVDATEAFDIGVTEEIDAVIIVQPDRGLEQDMVVCPICPGIQTCNPTTGQCEEPLEVISIVIVFRGAFALSGRVPIAASPVSVRWASFATSKLVSAMMKSLAKHLKIAHHSPPVSMISASKAALMTINAGTKRAT